MSVCPHDSEMFCEGIEECRLLTDCEVLSG